MVSSTGVFFENVRETHWTDFSYSEKKKVEASEMTLCVTVAPHRKRSCRSPRKSHISRKKWSRWRGASKKSRSQKDVTIQRGRYSPYTATFSAGISSVKLVCSSWILSTMSFPIRSPQMLSVISMTSSIRSSIHGYWEREESLTFPKNGSMLESPMETLVKRKRG